MLQITLSGSKKKSWKKKGLWRVLTQNQGSLYQQKLLKLCIHFKRGMKLVG